ncbi:MAG: hypothetical protein ACYDH9_26070 [Limisphaerales bacterium]
MGKVNGAGFKSVLCLASASGSLFAGGGFTNLDGVAVSGIAQWNGRVWSPLGSGLGAGGAYAAAMASVGSDLFVLGNFVTAGLNPSSGIALWHGPTSVAAPQIAAMLSGSQLVLSWPAAAAGYALETSSMLGAGASWAPLTSGIVTNGDHLARTNLVTGAAAFFRLHQP